MQKVKFAPVVLSIITSVFAGASTADYVILSDVVSSSGGEAQSHRYLLRASIGQPVIGLSSSDRYVETVGFLHWGTPPGLPGGVMDEFPLAAPLPEAFDLSQNHPNPFNPATTIDYSLPEAVHVRLEIFNVLGRRVRTLVDEPQAAGFRTVQWDGRDDRGVDLASGIYYFRLHAGEYSSSKKLVLLK